MNPRVARLAARLIRATTAVDAGFRRFDQVRSALITRTVSDPILDAYNDLAYGAASVYRAGAQNFRAGLFNWEEEMVARVFPPPPGTVLVGGAGGGREAFALAGRGYDVLAFDPSVALARSMVGGGESGGRIQAAVGRYEALPGLASLNGTRSVDVRDRAPFRAALFGWTSFSHIRRSAERIKALRVIGGVTDGPIVLSFYLRQHRTVDSASRARRVADRLGLASDGDFFTPHIGFYHLSTPDEIEAEIRDAGLEILESCYDEQDGRWPWIAARAPRDAYRNT
jgi:hypothetical protein